MGTGSVEAAQVRAMLGLADRGRVYDLVEKLLAGAPGEALELFARLHRDGAEPQQILGDLCEVVHVVTRAKAFGADAASEGLSGEERRRAALLGGRLSMAILARAWQLLLKGLEETANAPNPTAAAEMVLIRLAYTADLPPPDEIVKALGGAATVTRSASEPVSAEQTGRAGAAVDMAGRFEAGGEDVENDAGDDEGESLDVAVSALPAVESFLDVVEFVGAQRDAKLKVHLEQHVSSR